MIKIKLTPQQKAYVKSIDSKKKRKKQKEEFLMHNFFDSILKESGDGTTTTIVLNFEPDQSQPIEKLTDNSVTKRIRLANTMLLAEDISLEDCIRYKKEMVYLGEYAIAAEFRDREKEIEAKNTELNLKSNHPKLTKEILREVTDRKISKHINYGCFKNDRKPKTYTHEDMFSCFSESRIPHISNGYTWKHDSFAAYLKSLE